MVIFVPKDQPFEVLHEGKPHEYRRYLCTADRPWKEGHAGRWTHPDAKSISGSDEYHGVSGGGNYERNHCPHCNLTFRVTLPD